MPLEAVFGINSSGLNTAIKLLVLFLVVIYVALIYYTFADARRRIEDPMLVGCATAASLFPFVGTIVYMIVRPPEYLDDVRERELEMQAAEARLHQMGFFACPHCDGEGQEDFLPCPPCLRSHKDAYTTRSKPLDPSWKICPFCESEIPGVTPQPRRRRRRSTRAPAEWPPARDPVTPPAAPRRPPPPLNPTPKESHVRGPAPHPGQARRVLA